MLIPSPLDIPRSRPLATSLAVPNDSRQLTFPERSYEPAMLGFQEGLLTPRDSSRRHTTFVNAPGYHISATASIHDADEPVGLAGEAALRRPSATLPSEHGFQARASVTSQKAPFPFLSPQKAREQEAVLEHGQSDPRHPNHRINPKTRALIVFIWRNKTRVVIILIVVFHISLISIAAAATIAIRDSKHHVLKAGSVIAGVLGAAGYIASVLCGWALWLDCCRVQKKNSKDKDVEAGKVLSGEPRELSEKETGNGSSQPANQLQQETQYHSPASNSTVPRPEGVVRGPHRMQDGWISYPTPSSFMSGQELPQLRSNPPNGVYLIGPRSIQPSTTALTLPSSSFLPLSAFSNLERTPRREDPGMYRERLESRLRQREYLGENPKSEGFDNRDAEQQKGLNINIAHGNDSTQPRRARNPETQTEHSQARRATYHHNNGPQTPSTTTTTPRPLSSPLPLALPLPLPQHISKQQHALRLPPPSVMITSAAAAADTDPMRSPPPLTAYPPRLSIPSHSWTSSHSTTPHLTPSPTNPFDEVQHRSYLSLSLSPSPFPFPAPPSPMTAPPSSLHTSYPAPPSANPILLSPTYPRHYSTLTDETGTGTEESGDREVSETSSMREERDAKSAQKVRVWLDFMVDGAGRVEEVGEGGRGSGESR